MAGSDAAGGSNPSRRKPSRSFASYPLRGAVEGVKVAGASGSDHSRDAFASYLGHETSNSGGFKRKLASIKDWGLVETGNERVVITDLGMRIAHPRDEADEAAAIREAFMQAEVFAATYSDLAKGIDLTVDRIGSMGVHEHGISPGAKADFSRSFTESAVFAGLGLRRADGVIRLVAGPGEDASETKTASGASGRVRDDGDKARGVPRSPHGRVPGEPPPAIHQEWSVANGSVLFEVRLNGPLPSAAFATLAQVMEVVERLVTSLGPIDAAEPPTGD